MFANAYQNNHYFEVWDSKSNNDKNDSCKSLCKVLPVSNKKYFDKQIKNYVLSLEQQNSRIIFPASDQKQLALHQKYLILHILIPNGSTWSMQLGITDITGIRRRINLTTMQSKNQPKYFSLRYTIQTLIKGTWLFLGINIHSFIQAFKGQVSRSLDHLIINNTCILRRIFTMKEWEYWDIPKIYWFGNQIQQEFQLIEYRELTLPKINLHRSQNKDQIQYNKSDKIQRQQTIRHSKSNLIKSQIPSKILHKNKITQSSPIKSTIETMIQKKKSINLRNNIYKNKINTKSQKLTNLDQKNILKIKQYLNQFQFNQNQHSYHSKSKQKTLEHNSVCYHKKSNQKFYKLQKSFQEDQAFLNQIYHQSSGNFQTSNQSFNAVHKPTQVNSHIERWQANTQDKVVQENTEQRKKKEKMFTKQSRTVLSKENDIKKIKTNQSKVQLQLIYDQMVGCYYHPETQTYYQIKQ